MPGPPLSFLYHTGIPSPLLPRGGEPYSPMYSIMSHQRKTLKNHLNTVLLGLTLESHCRIISPKDGRSKLSVKLWYKRNSASTNLSQSPLDVACLRGPKRRKLLKCFIERTRRPKKKCNCRINVEKLQRRGSYNYQCLTEHSTEQVGFEMKVVCPTGA